eukprot:26835-Prymnesium_polylepis.5
MERLDRDITSTSADTIRRNASANVVLRWKSTTRSLEGRHEPDLEAPVDAAMPARVAAMSVEFPLVWSRTSGARFQGASNLCTVDIARA